MAKAAVVSRKLESEQRRMKVILQTLEREYPEAECSLIFKTPFQLLIATLLSAQCTDERVNRVTPDLFKKYPTAAAMAKASVSEIQEFIKSVNFFRNKAQAISETSKILESTYQGEVPQEMEKLVKLRGVGRKTANVVLGVGFQVPSLVVDTHVGRLSRRLGFTRSSDPVRVEEELVQIVQRESWTVYAHLLICHGRKICTARKANCDQCVIKDYCPRVGV